MNGSEHIVVLGAGNETGRAILARLSCSGRHRITAVRRPGSEPIQGVQTSHLELSDPDAGRRILALGVTVVLSVAPLPLAAACLSEALASGGVRVVACSSTSVRVRAESKVRSDRRVAVGLRSAEQRLERTAGWSRCTVIRPTMIYGPSGAGAIGTLQRLARRIGFLPCPAEPTGLRQPVHADDLAQAFVEAAERDAAGGRIVEIGGGERLSLRELICRVAATTGVPCRSVPRALTQFVRTPVLLPFLGPYAGAVHRLGQDQVVDNEAMTTLLGIRPRPFDPDGSR